MFRIMSKSKYTEMRDTSNKAKLLNKRLRKEIVDLLYEKDRLKKENETLKNILRDAEQILIDKENQIKGFLIHLQKSRIQELIGKE